MKSFFFKETVRSFHVLDWAALLIAVALSLGATLFARSQYGDSAFVAIEAEGKSLLYSLDEDRILEFDGPLGRTIVIIEDRQVRVTEDPGPLQICVRDGWIDRAGEWLICLPNQVFIRIEGNQEDSEIDATVF